MCQKFKLPIELHPWLLLLLLSLLLLQPLLLLQLTLLAVPVPLCCRRLRWRWTILSPLFLLQFYSSLQHSPFPHLFFGGRFEFTPAEWNARDGSRLTTDGVAALPLRRRGALSESNQVEGSGGGLSGPRPQAAHIFSPAGLSMSNRYVIFPNDATMLSMQTRRKPMKADIT